jgi:hypothetical protein
LKLRLTASRSFWKGWRELAISLKEKLNLERLILSFDGTAIIKVSLNMPTLPCDLFATGDVPISLFDTELPVTYRKASDSVTMQDSAYK